jgi:pyruvate dehydrogenase E2 component (dihydrolipoamide acetyltransferase)
MDVRLPKLGEGADAGTVVNLFVKEGEEIKKGQTILELENEKAVAPIPSPADGTVDKIRVKAGDRITVGQLILTMSSKGGTEEKPKGKPVESKATSAKKPEPEPSEDEADDHAPEAEGEDSETQNKPPVPPPASPSLRKLSRDLGIDLGRVKGSEPGGRIVLGDVRAYIQRLQQLAFAAKPGKPGKAAKPLAESIDFSKWGPIRKQPLTQLRKTIAERMVESWTTIPHVTQFDEADISALMELRKKLSPAYEAKGGRLTFTCFALKIVAATLKKFPIFNSSLDENSQELVTKEYVHIGLAVDTEAGLIVPVIRDVDKKGLLTLAKELAELAAKARDRKVSLEDLKGGSFTISNQGGIGGGHFTPIINKPDVAILGLGRSVLKPAVDHGQVVPRTLLPLCLSYDHRVIDGGQAARFISELVGAFQTYKEEDATM